MSILTILILGLFGLAVGSFLNVFLIRYDPEKDRFFGLSRTRGRSVCPRCGVVLRWYELLPVVSFVIQVRRCRRCKGLVSWQYPFVELISAAVFIFVPMFLRSFFSYWYPSWEGLFILLSAFWIVALLALLMVFIVDLRHYIIPNSLNITIFAMGVLWAVAGIRFGVFENVFGGSFLKQYHQLFFTFDSVWTNHLLGFFAAILFFAAIFFLSRGKAIGMGDVKLIGGLGILFGWPDILLVMFLSFVIGAIYSLVLMARGTKSMTDVVPFGPFIVIASFLTFFWGSGLLSLYFGIIGV